MYSNIAQNDCNYTFSAMANSLPQLGESMKCFSDLQQAPDKVKPSLKDM